MNISTYLLIVLELIMASEATVAEDRADLEIDRYLQPIEVKDTTH